MARSRFPVASSMTFAERCRMARSGRAQSERRALTVKAGRSRFTLSTLPAADFPAVDEIAAKQTLRLGRAATSGGLIEKTHFSMAQQDVRYYLNGLLLETEARSSGRWRRTAIGWRCAEVDARNAAAAHDEQVIVPRKGVLELQSAARGRRRRDTALWEQSHSGPDRRTFASLRS